MSTGQAVGAVAGGAIGFFVGGPTGALYGAQIGMAAGGYLDPPKGPTQSGPRLSDTSQQTSTYGATIPRVYGTIGVLGNIFWLENNKLKEVVKKKKSGGKGGGSSATVKTYTYYGTFAVGLCEGPIAGVRRIWVGPDLVYDAGSDDLETIIASNQASSKFSIYLGTEDQQPDSRMQAEMGAANCPAYRGLAYVVIKDLLLTKYGNSIQGAPIKAEVVSDISVSPYLSKQIETYFTMPPSFTFIPRPYFISLEKICFYVPQWDNTYPASSSAIKYEVHQSGQVIKSVVDVTGGTGVPPNGDSDSDSEFWKDKSVIFSGGGAFFGQDGYIQRRGAIYAGISNSGGRKLFAGENGLLPSGLSVSTTASCFAISGDNIYAISPTGVIVYDRNLSIVSTHILTIPSLSFPSARAELVDGSLLVYSGDTASKIYAITSSLDSITLIADVPSAPISYYGTTVDLSTGILVRANGYETPSATLKSQWYTLSLATPNDVSLESIVSSECSRSGLLTDSDIDLSSLTDTVSGFKVSNVGGIRSAIEPLQGAFPFDIIQSGYKIKAVPRGQSPVATLDIGDLGIEEQLRQAREMDTQLPTKIIANYLDEARNYDANEQFWERPSSGAVNTRTMELPIVMGASQALQVVERLGNLYWLERTEFGPFTLPPPFSYLEAGDVVTLHAGYADYELRLTTVNYQSDGSLACSAKLNNPSLYISQAASNETPDATTIALAGASLYALLDIPVVDETLQNSPGMVGVMTGYTNGWPGGVVYRSPDEGQTWDDIQAFSAKGTLGYARGVLGVHAGNLIDYGSTLTVDLLSGEFSAITEAQMLNGANMVAYGAHGRWEILRFAGATINADGSRTISTLIRGDRGTEWATGLHVAGDLFVLLDDPDGAWISMPTELIGAPRTYRGITSGADIDSATSATLTYQGVNLECLSPVSAKGSRDGSDNFAGTFTRRSRLSSSWWSIGIEAPVGETTQAYEIDVMSGSSVKRTISAVTPSFSYSAADQATDFGSAQAAITFRIYQMSQAVGRGYPLEVTL